MKVYSSRLFLIFFLIALLSSSGISQMLKSGDGVKITFYNITDEVSGDYYIQQNGELQLPYIGVVEAYGRSFAEIKTEILNRYYQLYRNPELSVQPLYKISILGEVSKPGIYYVTGVEKLSDLLAMAGGETQDANLDNIYFIQNDEKIDVNAREMLEKGNRVSDFGLKSGDQIYVPKKWWVGVRKSSVVFSAIALGITVYSVFIR